MHRHSSSHLLNARCHFTFTHSTAPSTHSTRQRWRENNGPNHTQTQMSNTNNNTVLPSIQMCIMPVQLWSEARVVVLEKPSQHDISRTSGKLQQKFMWPTHHTHTQRDDIALITSAIAGGFAFLCCPYRDERTRIMAYMALHGNGSRLYLISCSCAEESQSHHLIICACSGWEDFQYHKVIKTHTVFWCPDLYALQIRQQAPSTCGVTPSVGGTIKNSLLANFTDSTFLLYFFFSFFAMLSSKWDFWYENWYSKT